MGAPGDRPLPSGLLPISASWPERPLGHWLDELAAWVAENHPTPLELPDPVLRARRSLGLPQGDHLIVTTNHAALTLSPWNLFRCLVAEELARRLNERGVAARSVVLPLDHNTIGDANRPGVLFLGGRTWSWPGLPRRTRRVVATVPLRHPQAQWWRRIRETLLQDAAAGWICLRDGLGGVSRSAFRDRAAEALGRVEEVLLGESRGGRADVVWTDTQRGLLSALGLTRTTVLGMAAVESALAGSAALAPEFWRALRAAPAPEGSPAVDWAGGPFWFLCAATCAGAGVLQPTFWGSGSVLCRGRCGSCGVLQEWSAADVASAVDEGSLHPRVHLLVLWLRRGLAPLLHTAGPSMIRYAPSVHALEGELPDEAGLPPQLFIPLGRAAAGTVVSPFFLPGMTLIRSMEGRGRDLWRGVLGIWAGGESWDAVERRFGPRLRAGGFPPAERGVLRSALESWGWWPPEPARLPAGGNPDDLLPCFLGFTRPFRWSGGWDWLYAVASPQDALEASGGTPLLEMQIAGPDDEPRAPSVPVRLPRWACDKALREDWEAALGARLSC